MTTVIEFGLIMFYFNYFDITISKHLSSTMDTRIESGLTLFRLNPSNFTRDDIEPQTE